jgi:hypothetical protein
VDISKNLEHFFSFFGFLLEGLEVSNKLVERWPSTWEAYKKRKQEEKKKVQMVRNKKKK